MTHVYDPAEQVPVQHQYADRPITAPALNNASAVSWAAIFAGAVAAAALAMILLMLGTGLGLSSVSPWEDHGVSAKTLGIATIAWLMFTQIAASGMGGYLAGRLRTKWVDTHVDEVYFRDTAHGFLAWAVAALISAVLLTSTLGSIIGGGAKTAGAVAGGATATVSTMGGMMADGKGPAGMSGNSTGYFIHSLFRASNSPAAAATAPTTDGQPAVTTTPQGTMSPAQPVSPAEMGEVTGIFANAISTGTLPPEDLTYVGQLVSQKTGISQQEAEQRVQAAFTKAQTKIQDAKTEVKKAADSARKTTSYVALWTFISLLIGAFVASLCATFGGRQRDL